MSEPLFKHKDCPTSGTGVHAWLFYMAYRARDEKIEKDTAIAYIAPLMSRPPAPPQEVEHAIDAAYGGVTSKMPRWPSKNFKLIQEIFKTPLPDWAPLEISAEEAVDYLFPGNPLLCVGFDSSKFRTRPREEMRGSLDKCSLIVPSPMSARRGYSQAARRELAAGKKFVPMSEHTLENTGPRRYLITEFDWGTQQNQMKLINHMAKTAPLVAVVWSGSKSLHAWWCCAGKDEDKLENWMKYAVSVGADFRTWLKSQFVRLPAGWRHDKNTRQEILYFNPDKIKQHE
jgi:hypothetical protein